MKDFINDSNYVALKDLLSATRTKLGFLYMTVQDSNCTSDNKDKNLLHNYSGMEHQRHCFLR